MDEIKELFLSILVVLVVVGIIGLFIFAIHSSFEAKREFALKIAAEYEKCLAAKETEYTCKAYIQSMEAKRSADEAESSASFAAGMSAASIGFAAGSRR